MTRPIWYDSTETGAPTLNNAAGSLLEVFRACLVNGFNLKSVTSIVVASGVATATAATHGYSSAYGKLLRIEGAPDAGLNGDVQPLTVDTNTFTYACPGVPDGTYTGTITARRAPLGWAEAHTGTNKAIFARTDPAAGPQMLRVVDTGAAPALVTDARLLMIESATDIDAFANPSPTSSQIADGAGGYLIKGINSTSAKPWGLVGTSRGFYFFGPLAYVSTFGEKDRLSYFFGDGVRFFPDDQHFCLLSMSNVSYSNSTLSKIGIANAVGAAWAATGAQANVVARSRDGSKVSEVFDTKSLIPERFGAISAMPSGVMPEKLFLSYPVHIVSDLSAREVRGVLPGIAAPVANLPFSGLGALSIIGPTQTDGRVYLAVQASAGGGACNFCIDLTGPWYE